MQTAFAGNLSARFAEIHALAFASSVMRPWSAAEFDGLLGLSSTRLYTEGTGSEIHGFALFSTVLDQAELLTLAVEPSKWGKDIAGSLLRISHQGLARQGIHRVLLEVATSNNRAIYVYARSGYLTCGSRSRYYRRNGQSEDAVVMEKLLR